MKFQLYDPKPYGNEYASRMFFQPMQAWAGNNGIEFRQIDSLLKVESGSTVVVLTDHLSEELILMLKNNGNKIVGLNVTDSSYISGAIRYAPSLPLVDLIFMVSGIPITNAGSELAVDPWFNVTLVDRPFLDMENWKIFDAMHARRQLQSLPYVPWTPIPDVPREPWSRRSQKALIRGGGHARRFLLALFLMRQDKLDPNSGFVLGPYFADDMNPQFRYCDTCRQGYKQVRRAFYEPNQDAAGCNGPHRQQGWPGTEWTLDDLGQWNNRCPRSFFWMAEQFARVHGPVDMDIVENMLNARWLHPGEHLAMLGRILFTSDLKWEHSIFMPQRFWEGASAGCINVLPMRTARQDYFPSLESGTHYLVFQEDFKSLEFAFDIDESSYNAMAGETRALYDQWIQPTTFGINTNLLSHIFEEMRKA